MNKLFFIFLLLFIFTQVKSQQHTFIYNDETRYYYFYLPASAPENAPLIFVLHGYSGSATDIRNYSDFNNIADEHGFAVCYPQGTFDDWSCRFWNVGYSFHSNQTVDDVGFITALAAHLQTAHNLSSQFTFCTGMSNGGDMCYLLAAQASHVFRAAAPVAGCMMQWIYDSCDPDQPIPLFEIHGTADDITWWEGDVEDTQGYGPYMGVETSIDLWAQLNDCQQILIDTLEDISSADGSIVEWNRHINGINNNQVWLYKVINGGHDWPGSWGNMDVDASREIWTFFSQVISTSTSADEWNDTPYTEQFALYQNYPNPFNNSTVIRYQLYKPALVQLTVFNSLGMTVAGLVNGQKTAGVHSCRWDGVDKQGNLLSSGIYLLQLRVGSQVSSQKIVIIK